MQEKTAIIFRKKQIITIEKYCGNKRLARQLRNSSKMFSKP